MRLTTFQKKFFTLIMLVSSINFFMGCNRYFKPVAVNAPTSEHKHESLKKLKGANKYFILRTKNQSYAMKDVVLDDSSMTVRASLSQTLDGHHLYVDAVDNKFQIPKNGENAIVLQEVHLFTSDTTLQDTIKPYILPLSAVEKIEVIEYDQKRTTSSYVWGSVGLAIGAALVVIVLVAILMPEDEDEPPPPPQEGSCPYISTLNGEEFELQGEIYSGAIYPALQKEDYLPLKMKPVNGAYNLKISNELKEIQYTDFADLVVVEHNKNVRLLVDPQGKFHSISKPEQAIKANLNNSTDVIQELNSIDYNSCLFKDGNGTQNSEDLYLTFNNKARQNKAKLVLNARSSSWFNYLYNEFTKGFGNYYPKWEKSQEKKTAGELEKWIDEQYIPLTISVRTADGWKVVNKLNVIGPLLNREVVIPLDIPAGDQAEVKISGGYLFWELDYAAIDYSEDSPFTMHEIKPYEAINEKGTSVLSELQFADKKYYEQPNVGDSVVIKYNEITPSSGMAQTFFFHTSGYYHHPREHSGTPRLGFLKSFEQPGALSAFSKRIFLEPLDALETAKK